ncbi:TIR domain-containing protein [Bradyrhizobium sacchari]|uniref:TIR-like protein DUF1863 n=1 Tax=Bradyrhizobium sacchari TaxID=1399419 RepID=A0A560JCJ3_9BRAD|nr:TIR domain-containing protein [Bradyrhizobium sacchari]TWB50884.1 TIR-like protein DUF1863 [Bradyrhizobium sacchari]TWB68908.1 TIR-like protein DUF1863 [Bradyrhizobium sacchari]
MSYNQVGALPLIKHKVFVSYHHGGDQAYYDAFSKAFHATYESIYDNSLERRIDSDNVDYVRRRIREDYIKGSSCTIVLVGAQTWGRKYVDWEIDATLEMSHGLVGIRLPSAPMRDGKVVVPDRLHDNITSGFALWETWAHVTAGAAQLDSCIAAAKLRSPRLIDNSRGRRLRNA